MNIDQKILEMHDEIERGLEKLRSFDPPKKKDVIVTGNTTILSNCDNGSSSLAFTIGNETVGLRGMTGISGLQGSSWSGLWGYAGATGYDGSTGIYDGSTGIGVTGIDYGGATGMDEFGGYTGYAGCTHFFDDNNKRCVKCGIGMEKAKIKMINKVMNRPKPSQGYLARS